MPHPLDSIPTSAASHARTPSDTPAGQHPSNLNPTPATCRVDPVLPVPQAARGGPSSGRVRAGRRVRLQLPPTLAMLLTSVPGFSLVATTPSATARPDVVLSQLMVPANRPEPRATASPTSRWLLFCVRDHPIKREAVAVVYSPLRQSLPAPAFGFNPILVPGRRPSRAPRLNQDS